MASELRTTHRASVTTGRGQIDLWLGTDNAGVAHLWALHRTDDWLVARRLVVVGETLEVGEVKVFPEESDERRAELGVEGPYWSADRLGAGAELPEDGVPASVLRKAHGRDAKRDLAQALRLAHASHPELFAPLGVTPGGGDG